MVRLVILDRDGVINHDSPEYIKSPDEWVAIPGSLEAITRLNHSGFHVVLATNQSAIGRRIIDIETLSRIHNRMHEQLAELGGNIDAIFFCPHAPRDGCECRKPRPGMLLDIADRVRVSLEDVPFVGDSPADALAAQAAGAIPHIVRTGGGAEAESNGTLPAGVSVHDDLGAFVDDLLVRTASAPG